ncbi:22796_t:CDS:2, partial [Gigaspora rosea]
DFNLTIENINKTLQIDIRKADEVWTEEALLDLKGCLEQVLDKTRMHFQNQFRKRQARLDEKGQISQGWQDVYEPRAAIQMSCGNKKLVSTFTNAAQNVLALPLLLPEVSKDKKQKEWIMVKNRNKSRSICKIMKKQKVKVLREHYCNITLEESNLMELKKCSGCGKNVLEGSDKSIKGTFIIQVGQNQILGTLPKSYLKGKTRILDLEQERITGKFKMESPTNYPGESPFHSVSPLEGPELELLKKQNFNESLETVLQKSLVRNIESGEKELFFYTDGSLQLRSMDRSNSKMVMELGWLQLSNDNSYILDKGYAKIRDWPSSTHPELAAICLAAIEAIDNSNRLLANSHSKDCWNRRADVLAKKGLSAEENWVVVPSQALSLGMTLRWKHFLIEGPVRHFLKLDLDVKTGTELRNTKTFRKIEPQISESKFCWNLLWKNFREINGVRCNAMHKSKKLCTLWKCLQGKHLVLSELGARFFMLYSNTTCKLCNTDEWKLIEGSIFAILLKEINAKEGIMITESQLESLLLGSTYEEIMQTREFLIRGLIRKDTEEKLVKLLKFPAEARVLLKITKKAKLDLIKRRQNKSLISRKARKMRPTLFAEKTSKQGGLQVREPEVTSALWDKVIELWSCSIER